MAGFLNRAMNYLGLTPDDEFEAYEDDVAPEPVDDRRPAPVRPAPEPAPTRPTAAAPPAAAPAKPAQKAPQKAAKPQQPAPRQTGGRPAPPPPAKPRQQPPAAAPARPPRPAPAEAEAPVVRPVPASVAAAAEPTGTKSRPAVRAVPAAPKVATVSPMHFNDVQEIADRFKQSQPVIMNLRGAEKPLARRLLDFSSGICYALGGTMEKVATQVYLLTPEGVEVTEDDKRRMYERGLFG